MMSDWVVFQRLCLITVLAGIVGFERERQGRAAGFRTHILVGLGSCLMMITGLYVMDVWGGSTNIDPTRIAAQVVSGIGFLGAGTILRYGASIRGLTTAASLWVVAGIGIAVGTGFASAAAMATGLAIAALFVLSSFERSMRREWFHVIRIEAANPGDVLIQARQVLAEKHVDVRNFEIRRSDRSDQTVLELSVRLTSEGHKDELTRDICSIPGVKRVDWA